VSIITVISDLKQLDRIKGKYMRGKEKENPVLFAAGK
jgi:hypothetical protein